MAEVYIALGSNLGNREANLRMALRGMTRMARIAAVSSLHETEPVGPVQPPFCNAVCAIETGLEPLSLLRFLKALEEEIGRRPSTDWGPRPIDLDILLYGDRIVEDDMLVVPHPRLTERAFVLTPIAEIAAKAVHPGLGKTIAELEAAIDATGVKRIAAVGWDGVLGTEGRVRV